MLSTRALALFALAPLAAANTYVVDVGGTGQFTDLPAAIAFAQAGDILVVKNGTYSAFTLTKGLVIVGQGNAVNVTAPSTVTGIPAGETAVLAHLLPGALAISNSAGHVLLQDLGTLKHLDADLCDDLRVSRTVVDPGITFPPQTGTTIHASRVEFAQCTLRGSTGMEVDHGDGGLGVEWTGGSRGYLMRSSVFGGDGATLYVANLFAGDGGQALTSDASYLLVAGLPTDRVKAGGGGFNWFYSGICTYDGTGATGAFLVNSMLRHSAVDFEGTMRLCVPAHCTYCGIIDISESASVIETPLPEDPTLEVAGTFVPGQTASFTIRGSPGSFATLTVGRQPMLRQVPGIVVEKLVSGKLTLLLGDIPANGKLVVSWPLPGSTPRGSYFLLQAATFSPFAVDVRLTNSVPVVVH